MITPLTILDSHWTTAQGPLELLVQWDGLSPDETSWENWAQLKEDYHLEDKVIFQGVEDDTEAQQQCTEDKVQKSMVPLQKTEVQIEGKAKRVITKPSYLKDYV